MGGALDFDGINAAALRSARSLLPSLIAGGKFRALNTSPAIQGETISIRARSPPTTELVSGRILLAITAAATLFRWSPMFAETAKAMPRANWQIGWGSRCSSRPMS